MRTQKALFLCLILLTTLLQPVLAINDYGEDEDYLGQVIDNYFNLDNVCSLDNVVWDSVNGYMLLDTYLGPSLENFSSYVEVDIPDKLTVVDTVVIMSDLSRSDESYVYKDMGVDYFGDFEVNFTCYADYSGCTNGGYGGIFGVTNVIDDGYNWANGILIMFRVDLIAPKYIDIILQDKVNGDSVIFTEAWGDDKTYYCTLERDGSDVTLEVYSNELRTVLLGSIVNAMTDLAYRYVYSGFSINTGDVPVFTGSVSYLYNVSGLGDYYFNSGFFYANSILNGDPGLVYMYNTTIPASTSITMEFSTDNVTWVDHNNQAGSDTLIAGYEALDLRDVYNGTTYRRVNMTSDGSDTPRMWQDRFVTITRARAMGKYYAMTIILLILGILIGLGMRGRR